MDEAVKILNNVRFECQKEFGMGSLEVKTLWNAMVFLTQGEIRHERGIAFWAAPNIIYI